MTIEVHERVGADVPTALVEGVLRVYSCTLIAGEPTALEHRSMRWLAAGELEEVRWLETDRPLVPALVALLAQ